MAIALFDKFVNGIPTTVLEGKDVSQVILVDPPQDLPAFFLAGKGVLETQNKKIKIYSDDGTSVIETLDISSTDLKPLQDEIERLDGRIDTTDSNVSALDTRVGKVESKSNDNESSIATINQTLKNVESDISDNTEDIGALQKSSEQNSKDITSLTVRVSTNETNISSVTTTAEAADALSKANSKSLESALLKDEYGWGVGNLNIYDVSRLSRTNNAVNSSGVSIGDADVNLHGDTVGITSGNSATTYAVFTSGGLNLNNYPLTRLSSGLGADTNAANIGDVKQLIGEGTGLKPTDNQWDMLNYPIINVATSELESSAATVAQVNIVDAKTITNAAKISEVETTANAADTLSKDNKSRLDNLPSIPSLENYVQKDSDATLNTLEVQDKLTFRAEDSSEIDFSGVLKFNNGGFTKMAIVNSTIDVHIPFSMSNNRILNLASGEDGDNNAANIGDVKRIAAGITPDLDGYAKLDSNVSFSQVSSDDIRGLDVGALSIVNLGKIARNHTNDANSVTLENGSNSYKSNNHRFVTNDDVELATFSNNSLDLKGHVITSLNSGGDNDDRAANIGDVKRIASGTTPDLEGYAKLDDTVQFARVNIKNDFADDTKEPYFWCDPNNGNTVIGATGSLYFNQYAHDGTKTRWAIVDSSSRMTLDNATKVHTLTNQDAWSTDSTNDHAGFIRWDLDKRIIVGAKQDVTFQVNGKDVYKVKENGIDFSGLGNTANIKHDHNIDISIGAATNVAFKSNGMKLIRDVDGNNQSINNMGDIKFNSGYALIGKSNHNLEILNTRGIFSKELASDNAQSIELTDTSCFITATTTYIRTHNDGTILTADQSGFDFKGKPLKEVSEAQNEADVPNLGQVKALLDGLGTGLKFESYDTHNTTSGKTVFENQGHPNPFIDYIAPSGSAGINFDMSKQGQSVILAVRNNSGGTGSVDSNISFQGNSDQNISGVKIPVGYMMVAVFNAEIKKSYHMIVPFKNVQHGYSASSEDIELENVAPKTLFLTGDQGILESYISNPDTGELSLRQIDGYNIPKHDSDIAALEIQTEKNRSVTNYFLNESVLSYDWPDEARKPLVDVFVLNSSQTINNSSVEVTDNNDHTYSGKYNTVGAVAINSSGNWTSTYTYHNAYKHESSDYYVVFNQGNMSWQIIVAENPHTSIGDKAASTTVQLGSKSQLPETFGDYIIDQNFDDINSLEFIKAEVGVVMDDINSKAIIDFNGAKPSGYVVLK